MKAAMIHQFGDTPSIEEVPAPTPTAGHTIVDVLAFSTNNRTTAQINGTHYTAKNPLPFIPGLDGVGRTPSGQLVYFLTDDPYYGSFAEQTLVADRRMIPLAPDTDAAAVAAAMNPAMASWIAITRRLKDINGATVMILGATGAAGQAAVQIAKDQGASRVIAVGRNAKRLAETTALGADETIQLTSTAADALAAQANVDVVLDFLWGDVTASAMGAMLPKRSTEAPLRWVEIGSIAGNTLPLPAAALRGRNLQLLGSGQGSVAIADFAAALPPLAARLSKGDFLPVLNRQPFANLAASWQDTTHGRLVYELPTK